LSQIFVRPGICITEVFNAECFIWLLRSQRCQLDRRNFVPSFLLFDFHNDLVYYIVPFRSVGWQRLLLGEICRLKLFFLDRLGLGGQLLELVFDNFFRFRLDDGSFFHFILGFA